MSWVNISASGDNMKKLSWVLILCFAWLVHGATILTAAPYLEMSRSCDGEKLDAKQRFKINDWDGESKRVQSEKIYDFNVECVGEEKHLLELFLTSLSSNEFASKRYKEEDGALYKRTGTRRKSVKIRDARCEQVPEKVRTYPSDAEARRACRGSPTPMGCEMEYQGRDKWVTEMVERCYRARYEMRDVPRWTAFPFGYAPLPKGARIKNVTERKVAQATTNTKASSFSDVGPTGSITPSNKGPGIGTFLFFALLLGTGAYFYFNGLGAPPPEGYRARMESKWAGFGGQQNHTFDEPQYETSSGGYQQQSSNRYDPQSGDLPTTLEEVYILLNISADTSLDVAKEIYWGMMKAWHVDHATSEKDRAHREMKMKQLTAAKDFLTGRQT